MTSAAEKVDTPLEYLMDLRSFLVTNNRPTGERLERAVICITKTIMELQRLETFLVERDRPEPH